MMPILTGSRSWPSTPKPTSASASASAVQRRDRCLAEPGARRYHRDDPIGPRPPTLTKEDTMAAKAEALAKQFEAKVQEATGVFDRLSDADWKKAASEQWTVGLVAHHVARGHERISGIIKTV